MSDFLEHFNWFPGSGPTIGYMVIAFYGSWWIGSRVEKVKAEAKRATDALAHIEGHLERIERVLRTDSRYKENFERIEYTLAELRSDNRL